MYMSFTLYKAIGCVAGFGPFSPNDGLWNPKSDEERLAMKRGGKQSRLMVTEGWSRFEE